MSEVTVSDSLPAPAPLVTPETQPFWDATARGELLLKRCDDCQSVIWYPRAICPECHGMRTSWFAARGLGTIYSFSVVRRGDGPYESVAPYVLAYVELDEGPRVMTNVVGVEANAVEVGGRVEVIFHDTGEGNALPRFRPTSEEQT